MNISPINNTNFKSLEISMPMSWNTKYLKSFVENKEVQKAAKIFHERGINLLAIYHEQILYPERKSVSIVDKRNIMSNSIFRVKDLDTFSAEKAVAHYDKINNIQKDREKEIQGSLDFLDKFNKFLEQEN